MLTTTTSRLLAVTLSAVTLMAAASPAFAAPRVREYRVPVAPIADPPRAEPPIAITRPDALLRELTLAALETRRAEQIRRLKKYLEMGVFPRNRVSNRIINVFRDEDGLLCAIAYLINADGHFKLVDKTARENNLVKIGLVKSGPLLDWVLGSGLTAEEVAMVQLPDSPLNRRGGQEWILEENERIRLHMATAIALLEKNNATSLELATTRLLAAAR